MSEQEKASKSKKAIQIAYRQSPTYRNLYVSGAYGGLTPTGEIFMGIYSQRLHFPQASSVEVDPSGNSKEVDFVTDQGLVRDMEVGLMMDIGTAKAVHDWLHAKLEDAAKREKVLEERAAKKGTQ